MIRIRKIAKEYINYPFFSKSVLFRRLLYVYLGVSANNWLHLAEILHMFPKYDLIIIGAGHAGAECAYVAASLGASVLAVDPNKGFVKMSCSNSIGGIAKGQIVREIDALGGFTGIVADKSTTQFRMLNRSKGPAVWGPRSQNDVIHFGHTWQKALEAMPGIDFWQGMIRNILVEDNHVMGVITDTGLAIKSKAVVLTAGTFLNGLIHIGNKKFGGGRVGERSSQGLSNQLQELGFEVGRMNTGTTPRVDSRSLDYSKMEEQPGDAKKGKFSFEEVAYEPLPQRNCYITHTNEEVHNLIATHIEATPNLNGELGGKGPQYCPSIESKVIRFASKEQHQIFVQPMGIDSIEVYVNGFATALPESLQYEALRKLPGFANVKMFRPGYSIEYDYFPPTQLKGTLETKQVSGLYFAGQINGTTGYEEAACQGLIAGINACRKLRGEEPFILKRSEAYIGTLIDDLIHKGTAGDPYRMFTSRVTHRMFLRQDNADLRLTEKGYNIGLASIIRYERMKNKQSAVEELMRWIAAEKISPKTVNPLLLKLGGTPIRERQSIKQLLKRPEVTMNTLLGLDEHVRRPLATYHTLVVEQVAIQVKYEDFLLKEQQFAHKMEVLEERSIPKSFDYNRIKGLSTEAREKLQRIQPTCLGAASRISGVSPADIGVLMVYMGR